MKKKSFKKLGSKKNPKKIGQISTAFEMHRKMSEIKFEIKGQLEERKRISRELHDGVGGALSGIKFKIEKLRTEFSTKALEDILKNIENTCKEVRSISHNLMPPNFKEVSFIVLLNNYFHKTHEDGLSVNLEIFPEDKFDGLSEEIRFHIYRIIQELYKNIVMHSKASKADFLLTLHETHLNILVEDNGIGLQNHKPSSGLGFTNIKERVELMRGSLRIDSTKGTTFNIDIPVSE